jgi:phage terminase small subunit
MLCLAMVDSLNQRQQLFCDGLLTGMSQAEAYRRAGYSQTRAETEAAKLVRHPVISRYLATERQKTAASSRMDRTAVVDFLCRVVQGETQADGNQLRAVELLNRICGWSEPEKVDSKIEIVVRKL